MHADIPRGAVRSKRPEKWRTNCWFLLHDNAPAHRLVSVKDFLAKNNVTTLEHPPYSTDLAPTDFSCSVDKSALKGPRFCDATDVTKNVTEELKRFCTRWFQGVFPKPIQSLVEVFSCTNGLFWRKCTVMIVQ